MAVTQAQVAQLYVALFNRAPEGAGFNAWVNAGATKTVAQMANEMLASPATGPYFESLGIDIVSDRGYVENVYKNILGKDYSQDPDGINAWVKHLQLGNSRGDTLVKLFEVATSAEARAADPVAAQTFVNKTAISEYAAQKIADIPTDENGAYDFSLFQRIIAQTNNTNLDEQKAAIDALVAPTVHNLSADANDVSGTDRADVFNGAVSATVGQTTFKATDKLDGKGGNDTLNLDLYTNFHGMTNAVGEVKNIENLNLTNHTNGMLTFNTRNIHNMESITIDGSTNQQGVNIINPENKVKLNLKNIKLGANSLNLYYNTDVLASGNDDQEVTVDGVDTGTGKINITTVNNDKVEAVTVKAVGQASKLNKFVSDHLTGSSDGSIKTITVKGSADLTITGTSSLQTFDASGYTGNKLVANLSANNVVQSIKGSSQDDVFNITGTPGTIVPINGGAGRDVVNMLNTISGNKHVEMTGVEELNINPTNAPDAHTQLDFSRAQDIDTLGIGGAAVTPNKNVTVLNSNIKTVNINSDGETIVGLSDASLENYNIKKGTTTTLKTGGAQKLNVNVDAQTSQYFGLEGGVGLKEVNLTINKSAVPFSSAIGNHYNNTTFETLNIVNKTANAFENHRVVTKLADGSTVTNTTLKTLNVETKGDYELRYNVGGLSSINLKGTGETTKAQIVTQPGQSLGMPTDGRYPLQGTQDINLTAEDLKTLEVAKDKYIMTTRNVSLTSTTDKEDSTVKYGGIGTYDPYNAYYPAGGFFNYRPNNVTINAKGQKTLTVADIHATGDVTLTSYFTQSGSTVRYGSDTHTHPDPFHAGLGRNIPGYIAGDRDITINHSAANGIDDGVLNFVGWSWTQTGNYTFNISGYKTLNAFSAQSSNIVAYGDNGSINLNTNATVAGATAKFGDHSTDGGIQLRAKNLNINATAANGITDSEVSYGNFQGYKASGKVDIKAINQKSVVISEILGFDTATDAQRTDVDINLATNVTNSAVNIGNRATSSSVGIGNSGNNKVKSVNLKAHGQKDFKVKEIYASGDVNIDVKGGSSEAAAKFGDISGANVTLNANNLKNITLGAVTAKKDLTIKTGTNNHLDKVVFSGTLTGKTVNIDASNATAPLTDTDGSTPTPSIVNVFVKSEANIKTYGADSLNNFLIKLNPTLASEKDFTANLTNVRGIINSNASANSITETLTVKGGVTNPDSVAVAYNPANYGGISLANYATLTIETGNMTALKSIDYSAYHNTIGQAHVIAANEALETILGSNTTRTYIDVVSAGSSTKIKNIKTGAGNDLVDFQKTQENNVSVELGAGNDEIRLQSALTANKKFEISGGAGNDKFILGAAKTDANASKYVTITDIARGDKIDLGTATAFGKYTASNLDSESTLKDAINKVLTSSGANVANKIWAFSYGNETYLVRDNDGNNTALSANDNLVKLAGLAHFDYFSANLNSNVLEITNA